MKLHEEPFWPVELTVLDPSWWCRLFHWRHWRMEMKRSPIYKYDSKKNQPPGERVKMWATVDIDCMVCDRPVVVTEMLLERRKEE